MGHGEPSAALDPAGHPDRRAGSATTQWLWSSDQPLGLLDVVSNEF